MPEGRKYVALVACLALWNVFDIALHIAVDQVEPLRVSGNAVVIVSAVAIMFGAIGKLRLPIILTATIVFTALNVIWLIFDAEGFPVVAMILICVTIVGGILSAYLLNNRNKNYKPRNRNEWLNE